MKNKLLFIMILLITFLLGIDNVFASLAECTYSSGSVETIVTLKETGGISITYKNLPAGSGKSPNMGITRISMDDFYDGNTLKCPSTLYSRHVGLNGRTAVYAYCFKSAYSYNGKVENFLGTEQLINSKVNSSSSGENSSGPSVEKTCKYGGYIISLFDDGTIKGTSSTARVSMQPSITYEAFKEACPQKIYVAPYTYGTMSFATLSLTQNDSSYHEVFIDGYTPPPNNTGDTIGGSSNVITIDNPCENAGILKAMKIVSIIITIIKILVPVSLIIIGIISLTSAIINNDDAKIKPAINALIAKTIIGVVVAFIPNIIFAFAKMIDKYNESSTQYTNCIACLDSVSECDKLIKQYDKYGVQK